MAARPNVGKKWTQDEEQTLQRLYVDEGLTSGQCAAALGRNSIDYKLKQLCLHQKLQEQRLQSIRPISIKLQTSCPAAKGSPR